MGVEAEGVSLNQTVREKGVKLTCAITIEYNGVIFPFSCKGVGEDKIGLVL